jgi:hypothetical protein
VELSRHAVQEQSNQDTILLHKPLGIVSCQPEQYGGGDGGGQSQTPAVQLLTLDRQYHHCSNDDDESRNRGHQRRQRRMGEPKSRQGWAVAGRLDINNPQWKRNIWFAYQQLAQHKGRVPKIRIKYKKSLHFYDMVFKMERIFCKSNTLSNSMQINFNLYSRQANIITFDACVMPLAFGLFKHSSVCGLVMLSWVTCHVDGGDFCNHTNDFRKCRFGSSVGRDDIIMMMMMIVLMDMYTLSTNTTLHFEF